jgi:hypothetical protein
MIVGYTIAQLLCRKERNDRVNNGSGDQKPLQLRVEIVNGEITIISIMKLPSLSFETK